MSAPAFVRVNLSSLSQLKFLNTALSNTTLPFMYHMQASLNVIFCPFPSNIKFLYVQLLALF